ncbi:MAG: alpha-galactosidase [Bacteroidaceae bacterium]|nr:alpha-galactosidase [Bacteroidaceae bacterium]
MTRNITVLLSIILAFSVFAARATEKTVTISTKDIQLVYKVDKKNKLRQCYFGESMNDNAQHVQVTKHDAYPTFGTSYVNEPALRAVHADGNTSTELVYVSHKTEQTGDGIEHTEIELRDSFFPFNVTLCFNAYHKENVIEAWTVIKHSEKKPVMLYNYASSHLFFQEEKYFLTQFYGEWADEMHMTEMQLTRGIKSLESKLGVRSNQHAHACFFLGLDAPAQEDAGRVVGGTLAWPGSFNLTFDVDNLDNLHVICGINSFAGQYQLAKGEVFETPKMLYSYSSNGTGDVTRNFHRWAKKYGIWRGDRTRTTLLNNWEATYFDFNEEILTKIIGDAADMGFELFLLDDGWFGDKHPRNNDDAGLGDWMVNRKKLPNDRRVYVKGERIFDIVKGKISVDRFICNFSTP